MAGKPLRDNQGVNFSIASDHLLHFLADWFDDEVSRHFVISVVVSGNGTPNLVQVVPRGATAGEDETYFHLLERSLKEGSLEFWRRYSEFLPRLEVGAGKNR